MYCQNYALVTTFSLQKIVPLDFYSHGRDLLFPGFDGLHSSWIFVKWQIFVRMRDILSFSTTFNEF